MERKNKNFVKVIALCLPLLLGACGTKKIVEGNGSASTSQSQNANSSRGHQSEALKKLTFVQKVSDNQVYSKNIVGNMSFSLQMGSKDISVPGALRMRKDQVIRIQLFIPILGTEVGRLEFTPDYVLIIDRLHKEYIKADYNQVDFLKKQGVNFYSLQALFWNQLLLPGNQRVSESDLKKFDADLDAAGDVVPVTFKQGNMTYAWGADRNTGRILQSDVKYKTANSNSVLHIDYSNFKNVGVKQFPASLKLKFMTDLAKSDKEMQISIDMNAVKTDSNWEEETKVSDKYKKVSPEDVLSKIMNM
nr:DUF4292 domain-containing protein [Prevotella sp.]